MTVLAEKQADMLTPKAPLGRGEFIVLMAFMISLVAMSIDAVLPALGLIAQDMQLTDPNDRHWVLGGLFLGMTAGQIFYGPLADRYGRKPVAFFGLGLFMLGSLWAAWAGSFEELVWARVLQGVGVAGPRIVSTAIIRDRFVGAEMAKVTSIIMTVFIAVPVFAPMLGQGLLWVGPWQLMFYAFFACAVLVGLWLGIRQPETLEAPRPLSFASVGRAGLEVIQNPLSLCYTLSVGFAFGGLLTFLMASQQIYQDLFGVGEAYALYFAASAFTVGVASFVNSQLVDRFGMRPTVLLALGTGAVWVLGFGLINLIWPLTLWAWVACAVPLFFCLGLAFGNLNAMAMEPMGHIAGTASSVVGTLSSLVSVVVAAAVANLYDGDLDELLLAWGCVVLCAWLLALLPRFVLNLTAQ